jgi:hypothetical protein
MVIGNELNGGATFWGVADFGPLHAGEREYREDAGSPGLFFYQMVGQDVILSPALYLQPISA